MRLTRAQRRGRELRRELGLRGRVDAEALAEHLGLEVFSWPFRTLQEMKVDDVIGVAERLDASWRRWVIAHAIGHSLLHPGNHLWMQEHTLLGHRVEREAEEFAGALLVDEDEALERGLVHPSEVAEYFGVPEEMARNHSLWSGR
ncbi:MAG: ImmA/IrrE family metallo-endopeptidase [Chloroflexi bacterium]|nr:ImmA/IrrE family metallo-endopeptidase [Chloroflexota bacterium]